MTPSNDLRAAAAALSSARTIAVLTGAGISTPSGIPDFRSADGLYADARNEGVFDLDVFCRRPEHYYRFARSFYPLLASARPNAAHRALARWEQAGQSVRVATQNIDDLHQRAGSRQVHPVHGTVERSACMSCGAERATRLLWPSIQEGRVPRCDCGGVFKPDITFFGERLPEAAWALSVRAMAEADAVLVVGTSLSVHPAASLPGYRGTAALYVFNREPTALDPEAQGVFQGDLEEQVGALDAALKDLGR